MTRDPLEAVSEHNDTYTRCPACSQTFLFADAAECDGCETYLHPECRITCESCSYQYCDTCQYIDVLLARLSVLGEQHGK